MAHHQDAREIADALALSARAELPLAEALDACAEDAPTPRLRQLYLDLGQRLQAGLSLDAALEELGDRVPKRLRGLAAAGIATGRLGDVLSHTIRLEHRVRRLQMGVFRSLAYPSVLLALLVAVMLFVGPLVLQPMAQIAKDFDLPLPPGLQHLLDIPSFSVQSVLTLLIGTVVIVVSLWFISPRLRHRLIASLPLVGPIWRNGSWAGLTGQLQLMLEEQLPLPKALELTAAGLHDCDLAERCQQLAREVAAGRSLADEFARGPGLPNSLGPLIDWGSRSGTLPEVLGFASEMFIARCEAQSLFVRIALPLLLFLLILAGIVFLALIVFWPVLTFMSVFTKYF